jgi:hypothetical protein
MGSNSIPDPQENRHGVGIAPGSTPIKEEEIGPQSVLLLREFFLLLDQWDRQEKEK